MTDHIIDFAKELFLKIIAAIAASAFLKTLEKKSEASKPEEKNSKND